MPFERSCFRVEQLSDSKSSYCQLGFAIAPLCYSESFAAIKEHCLHHHIWSLNMNMMSLYSSGVTEVVKWCLSSTYDVLVFVIILGL
jgi:hypothetical protein